MKLLEIIAWPITFIRSKYNKGLRSLRIFIYKRSGVRIGDDCYISQHAYIDLHCPELIEIGNHVKITRWSMILCYDASKDWVPCKQHRGTAYGPVKIGTNVFIGAHSIVMPSVTIGDNVIVGANSLVLHNIPSNCVVAGSPAKKIKDLEMCE
jgi:maltose O-acetyltransferase